MTYGKKKVAKKDYFPLLSFWRENSYFSWPGPLSFHPLAVMIFYLCVTKSKEARTQKIVVITLKNGESLALLMIPANLHP